MPSNTKIAISNTLGTFLEYFDYTLYGFSAMIAFIESLAAPYFAYLSDQYGRFKIMAIGTAGMLLFAIPAFNSRRTDSLFNIVLGLTLLAICLACFDGPMRAYVLDQFPVGMRYSALGVSYNHGVGILGGGAPLILTLLIAKTHNPLMPGYFLAGLAIIVLTVFIVQVPKPTVLA